MKKNSLAQKLFAGALSLALALSVGVGLTACSDSSSDTSDDTTEETTDDTSSDDSTSTATLAAPTDFTLDVDTGEYSFTANDENVGYYFIRIFAVVNGEEASAYVASSSRINGGSTGTITGTIDLSSCGWGEYVVKLITYAAAGTDDEAPETVTLSMYCGVGGVLERPEMAVITDGSHVELIIDHYSLSDYLDYQYMPTVQFNIYSDADCTELVATYEVDTSEFVYDTHPAGGYCWPYTNNSTYAIADTYGLDAAVTIDDLEAGTYYVTATALSNDEEQIASSQASEAIEFTVTDEEADGEFTVTYSSLWQTPGVMGMPTAASGTYTDRVDFGGSQTTTNTLL